MSTTRTPSAGGERGAALIFLILSIVVLGALGAGMVSMYSSSAVESAMPDSARRARNMAEACVRYASSEIRNAPDKDVAIDALNDTALYTVPDGGSFKAEVFSLSSFTARCSGSPLNSGDLLQLEVARGKITAAFVNAITASMNSSDHLFAINGVDPGFTQGQGLNRVMTVASWDATHLNLTLKDAFTVADGNTIYLGVNVTSNGSLTAGTGGSLEVGSGASIFPDSNGAVFIKGKEYIYDRKTPIAGGRYNLVFSKASASVSVNSSEFIILNSSSTENLSLTCTGYAGSGAMAASKAISTNVTAQNAGGGGGGATPSHATYVTGAGNPTDVQKFGDPSNPDAYQGVKTSGGASLKASNLADLDAGRTMQGGGAHAGTDILNASCMYGNNAYGATIYQASGDPEIAIGTSTNAANAISRLDFRWTNNDWYSFDFAHNVAGDYAVTLAVTNTAGHAPVSALIPDPVNDPDHRAPNPTSILLAPPAGKTRYISNFWLDAYGNTNAHKVFTTRVRNLQLVVDKLPWPGVAWEPNKAYSAGATFSLVRPTYTTWAGGQAVALNALYVPSALNGRIYRCTQAGTTGGAEPAWTRTVGGVVNDGTARWTAEYGYVYRCTQGGTSGAVEPNWGTSFGGITDDGTARWTMGLPDFDTSTAGGEATFFLTQLDTAVSSVEVHAQFSVDASGWTSGNPDSTLGLQANFLLHDL